MDENVDEKFLPNRIEISLDNQEQVKQFCQHFNQDLLHLSEAETKKAIDLVLLLSNGVPSSYLNVGVCDALKTYLKNNIGRLDVTFDGNFIDKISFGTLTIQSMTCMPFSKSEEQEKSHKGKICYGKLPTTEYPDNLFMTVDNKLLVASPSLLPAGIASFNKNCVQFGQYYFNRDEILKNPSTNRIENPKVVKKFPRAQLVTFCPLKSLTMAHVISAYDENGRCQKQYMLDFMQPIKENTYHVYHQQMYFSDVQDYHIDNMIEERDTKNSSFGSDHR